MNKTLSFNEIETLYNFLVTEWSESVGNLRLSTKSLYNLISLKKIVEKQHNLIQETVVTIMQNCGAIEDTERGTLRVPDDRIAEANNQLMDLGNQVTDISYEAILVRENDVLSPKIMDVLYDFILIE